LLKLLSCNEDEKLVLNQTYRFNLGKFLLSFVFFVPIIITIYRGFVSSRPIEIAEVESYSTDDKREIIKTSYSEDQKGQDSEIVENYSIDEKRDIFKTFDTKSQNDQGLPIDPFDLMNRLKKAGAMDDATTPSDALDEALNAFEESEY